eukprot:191018_1
MDDLSAIKAEDWNKRTMKEKKQAIDSGVLELYDIQYTKKGQYDPHFQMTRIANTKECCEMTKCRYCWTFYATKPSGKSAWTTSSIAKHGCYVKKKPEEEKEDTGLSGDIIRECSKISAKGHATCIVKDSRPFRISEGDGFKDLARSYIEIGVKCKTVPTDEELDKIISKRKGNKTQVKEMYVLKQMMNH